MASAHADSHDLDKLTRWREGLVAAELSHFPVFAVFLVGPEDRVAHDVFREFRSSFEARNVPYENLVIFGQHGASKTLHGLGSGLGISPSDIPLLALIFSVTTSTFYTLPLPKGNSGQETKGEPWLSVLRLVEAASDSDQNVLDLDLIKEVRPRSIQDGSMESIMDELLLQLS